MLLVSARDRDVRARVLAAVESLSKEPAPAPRPVTADFSPTALARKVIHQDRDYHSSTARADAILLHPVLGPVLFLLVMTALFSAVFLVADPASRALDAVIRRSPRASWASWARTRSPPCCAMESWAAPARCWRSCRRSWC